MTTYLLEASLSLLLTFGFYKLWLESERLPRFKRFYLLGSLLFSALVPLLALEVAPASTIPLPALYPERALRELAAGQLLPAEPSANNNSTIYWLALYGSITALLLARFVRNLVRLLRRIVEHPTQLFQGATLVWLPAAGLPYTFLHYLFVPDAAYRNGEMEAELFTHELAHIRQRHSLDVLLLEVLLCVGWFNPVLYWYKRAMQLNHEFMADEAVNGRHRDVPRYQRLLLSKLTPTPPPALTSALTFQTTKQRLLMMTKHTSRRRTWLTRGSAALLLGMLTVLLGTTVAQIKPLPGSPPQLPKPRAATKSPGQQPKTEAAKMERLYGDKLVTLPQRPGVKGGKKKYSALSAEEKQWVKLIPFPSRRTPTEAQWAEWQNPRKFGIWVDGKRLRGQALSAYQRTDIVSFSGSYVHKNARQPEGYLYQMDLTTAPKYQQELASYTESPWLVIVKDRPKRR